MSTLHCPRCGFVVSFPDQYAAGLADDASIKCLECGLTYSPADGAIWDMRTTEAIAALAKFVYDLISYHGMRPEKFKAAIVKGLLELGWLGAPVAAPAVAPDAIDQRETYNLAKPEPNNRIDRAIDEASATVAHNFPGNREPTKG